jgi:hypothetical protein
MPAGSKLVNTGPKNAVAHNLAALVEGLAYTDSEEAILVLLLIFEGRSAEIFGVPVLQQK